MNVPAPERHIILIFVIHIVILFAQKLIIQITQKKCVQMMARVCVVNKLFNTYYLSIFFSIKMYKLHVKYLCPKT